MNIEQAISDSRLAYNLLWDQQYDLLMMDANDPVVAAELRKVQGRMDVLDDELNALMLKLRGIVPEPAEGLVPA